MSSFAPPRHAFPLVVAAALFAIRAPAAEPTPSAATADLPFGASPQIAIPLFNGRDLSGWKIFLKDSSVDPRSVWSVRDSVLHLAGKPNGYVYTEKNYSNYHLQVEWRWPADGSPKSNSGVFVHVHGPEAIWPAGLECQLASGNAGQVVGMEVRLPGAPIINNRPRAPKLAASSERPLGEWNSYDIVCRGGSIDVTVNGVHQNHVDGMSVNSGHIGLQMEGYPIEFRSIWLQPL